MGSLQRLKITLIFLKGIRGILELLLEIQMSLYKKYLDVYSNWDLETFKNIHHEDYMFVRETDLLTRDEHVDSFAKLSVDPNWNWDWFKAVEVLYEDEHVLLTRWEDKGDIVTNTSIIKDGLCWRAIVVRNPKNSQTF